MAKTESAAVRYPLARDAAPIGREPRDGSDHALGDMMLRYRGAIHAAAYAILGDYHAAEDVTQETFLIAYEKAGEVREPKALAGWLRRIALSRCSRAKRRQRVVAVSLDAAQLPASGEPDPPGAVLMLESRLLVLEALRNLPEHHRVVVTSFYLSGLSQRRIAERLNVPCTTVKKRLHDARLKLKEKLTADGTR